MLYAPPHPVSETPITPCGSFVVVLGNLSLYLNKRTGGWGVNMELVFSTLRPPTSKTKQSDFWEVGSWWPAADATPFSQPRGATCLRFADR